MNTSSLKRRLDKLEAAMSMDSPINTLDMSLFTEEEQAQFHGIFDSIPENGSLRNISDEQLRTLHNLSLVYKARCEKVW